MDPPKPKQPKADTIEQLSQILVELEEAPDNVPHRLKAIDLMANLDLASEQLDSLEKLSDLIMLNEGKPSKEKLIVAQWNTYFDLQDEVTTLDGLADMLEKYDRAEQDYQGEPCQNELI